MALLSTMALTANNCGGTGSEATPRSTVCVDLTSDSADLELRLTRFEVANMQDGIIGNDEVHVDVAVLNNSGEETSERCHVDDIDAGEVKELDDRFVLARLPYPDADEMFLVTVAAVESDGSGAGAVWKLISSAVAEVLTFLASEAVGKRPEAKAAQRATGLAASIVFADAFESVERAAMNDDDLVGLCVFVVTQVDATPLATPSEYCDLTDPNPLRHRLNRERAEWFFETAWVDRR